MSYKKTTNLFIFLVLNRGFPDFLGQKANWRCMPAKVFKMSCRGHGPIGGAPKPIGEIGPKCVRIDHLDLEEGMIILEKHVMYKHWHAFLFPSSDPRLGSCVPDEALVYSSLVFHCSWQKKYGQSKILSRDTSKITPKKDQKMKTP